jgi:hypothetical protein
MKAQFLLSEKMKINCPSFPKKKKKDMRSKADTVSRREDAGSISAW